MTIGIIIKGTNCIYFADYPSFFLEVCTGLVILLGLFGWMDVLIILKWFHTIDLDDYSIQPGVMTAIKTDSKNPADNIVENTYAGDYQNQKTPSVINVMIDTIFHFGTPTATAGTFPFYGP